MFIRVGCIFLVSPYVEISNCVRVLSIGVSLNLNADVGTVKISSGTHAFLRNIRHGRCPIGSYDGVASAFRYTEKESVSGRISVEHERSGEAFGGAKGNRRNHHGKPSQEAIIGGLSKMRSSIWLFERYAKEHTYPG